MMFWVETIASIFGLLCVWLTVRQNILCWPVGLIQVLLYIYIFYNVKLYSDAILQVIYVFMQIYGWYYWMNGGKDDSSLNVTSQTVLWNLGWVMLSITGAFMWGYIMANFTDAAVPYYDAFIVVASLIAQWLMARKNVESWFFWIAVDVVAIGVYFYKSLYVTTGLYTVFLILAISGYLAWRNSMLAAAKVGIGNDHRTYIR